MEEIKRLRETIGAQRSTLSKQYEIMQLAYAIINSNISSDNIAKFNQLWTTFHTPSDELKDINVTQSESQEELWEEVVRNRDFYGHAVWLRLVQKQFNITRRKP